MPKHCVAVGCTNHNMKEKKTSFHFFPVNEERRNNWAIAVRRQNHDSSQWQPSKHSHLCGEHFIEGKPNSDCSHPDYIPSIFGHKENHSEKMNQKVRRYL
ncbi:Uncharacterised protein r2_g2731 [Pycnogonum litorale]